MKRIGRGLGILIGLLGVVFVVRELARNRDEVLTAAAGADPLMLFASFALALASMTAIGFAWRRCLQVMEAPLPVLDTLRRYFVGQLGKYVPGGIWPVVGRAEMARRGGVSPTVAYGSTVLSLGLTYLAAVLTCVGALLAGAGGAGEVTWQPVVALLPLGVLSLHPRVVGYVLRVLRRVSRRELALPVPRWSTSIALLVRHVPPWLGIGAATWLVATTLDPSTPSFRNVLFATTLAWVLGFLAVGVPGGIGVREAVFVAAATSLSSLGVAAAAAVVARALFILTDVVAAGASSLIESRRLLGTTQRLR
jgi:glycosyltransferase 2 family protein